MKTIVSKAPPPQRETPATVPGLDPDRWVSRHGQAMFAYARLRLPSADLAEEAVQRALEAAWRSRESFRGNSTERTWLIGVLRYKVLDLIAERSKAAIGGSSIEETPIRGNANADDWSSGVEREELRVAIASALDELPDAMRQVLVLREIDGLSGKQVCEILGLSETNLWTMVHRAKARMRVALAARIGDDAESGQPTRGGGERPG